MMPYVPSSPGNQLELLSDSTNSLAVEAKAFENIIMTADTLVPPGSDCSDLLLLDVNIPNFFDQYPGTPILSPAKRKIQDLKIEGPLTPPIFHESPAKKVKSVSFPEMLHEYIPSLPSYFGPGEDAFNFETSAPDIFEGQLKTHHEEAERRLENEKLSEEDTTARAEVPIVDFSLPVAPWHEFGHRKTSGHLATKTELDAQTKFLVRVKRDYLKSASSWHGITKLEIDLPWMPFSQTGSITIREKLHGEEVLSKMLDELVTADIATSSTNIWKRGGLRILEEEDDSDDDELEVAEAEKWIPVDTEIVKGRPQLEEENIDAQLANKKAESIDSVSQASIYQQPTLQRDIMHSHHWVDPTSASASIGKPMRQQSAQPNQVALGPREHDSSLMFGGMYSASTALQLFTENYGKPVKMADERDGRMASSSKAPLPSTLSHPVQRSPMLQAFPPEHVHLELQEGRREPLETSPPLLPKLPSIPTNLPPCSFILSSTFLQQRRLARDIEKLYPDAHFVERDFTAPHSAAQEADLLLSPSTGLIFTTLQILKQRALPGQSERSPLRERVMKLQHRYERLIVIVSEGLNRQMEELGSSRPADSSDKGTITLFEHFASKLDGEVIVKYVRGGEIALGRSIVCEMAKWGLPHGSEDIGDFKAWQDEGCVSFSFTLLSEDKLMQNSGNYFSAA